MLRSFIIFIFASFSMNLMSQTKIIAHRGFSEIAPENTLSAFKKAIEIGADYLELDVHATADNVMVVIHDDSVNRTATNGETGKIKDLTFDELNKIKVGYPSKFASSYADEKIPTLHEVLELAKGKIKVCIEIKTLGIENEVLKIIEQTQMQNEVVIFSFYFEVLSQIRALNPNISLLYLVSHFEKHTVDYAKLIHVNAIGVGNENVITSEMLEQVHQAKMELWQWTINDSATIKNLIDLKIDGIITNKPDVGMELIKNK